MKFKSLLNYRDSEDETESGITPPVFLEDFPKWKRVAQQLITPWKMYECKNEICSISVWWYYGSAKDFSPNSRHFFFYKI